MTLGKIWIPSEYEGPEEQRVTFGSLVLNPYFAEAGWKGKEVHLTFPEFVIVRRLVECRTTLSQTKIEALACRSGHQDKHEVTPARVQMYRIKKKFKEVDLGFDAIITVLREGYRWFEESI